MKDWRQLKMGGLIMAGLIFGMNFDVVAQRVGSLNPGTNGSYHLLQNPAFANSPTALGTIRRVLATPPAPLSVPIFSTTNLSPRGTYWTIKSPVPLPGNFFPGLPVYLLDVTNRMYLVDDRSVDYVALQLLPGPENTNNSAAGQGWSLVQMIDTNRLWLSVATNGLPGSNQFNVVIHETVTGSLYDVLTKPDLLLPTWAVENTVTGAVGNATAVTVAQNNRTNLFVWARESIIPIFTQPLAQEVFSGDSATFTVGAGGGGLFYQWTFNGTNIYGATGSSYTIPNVNANNAGDYACIVHNADGSATTLAATLAVDPGSGWPYDMSAVGQRQDYTFRSGVTYLITSPVQLFGKTTIEGGAVIKFDYYGLYPCLQIMGTLECQGGPYNPAVLTSVDDDTFGMWEQDGSGYPQPVYTGAPFLDLTHAGNVSLSNLRFRYADMAVGAPDGARLDVWDCQFVQCNAGVVNYFGGTDGFHNVLFAGCYDAVAGDTNSYAIEMEQVTANVTNLWDSAVSPSRLALTNSIVFGGIGSVSAYSAQSVTVAPDAANFQTNGAGNYYLAAASSLRQSGTANISARLLAEMRQKTTTPPLAFPQLMNVSGNLTLMPQAARYAGGLPDQGYYYDAMDYTVAYMTVYGNLTIEPGTVTGVRNEPMAGTSYYTRYGLDLRENASVVSHGLPNRPNIFTDTQMVQEQDEYTCDALIVPDFQGAPTDTAPAMDFRFSKLYASAGGFQVWGGDWEFVAEGDTLASYDSLVNWTMRDCELHGGRISLGLPNNQMDWTQYYGSGAVDWENNLFEGVNINLNPATWWYNGVVNFDEAFTARNNLFKGGNWMAIEPVPASAGDWTFADNLFDGIDFQADPASPLDFDYNGYNPLPASQTLYNTMAFMLSLTANDTTALVSATNNLGALQEVYLDEAPPYASGALGNYYLSTITPLWQAGSRPAADAGLTQYTTFTSQAKDSADQPVNIGLHYVAATNSLPLDTDGDGVPDYVEAEHGTDPNNPMTDGVTPDAYNTAYDDADLDGDGLSGAAERYFGTNPLITDNPLNLPALPQQSTLSGVVQIPLNIGTNVDTNTPIYFEINDSSDNAWVFQTNGQWYAAWNTTAVANGTYWVQFEYPMDEESMYSETKFVNVQNGVCFPNDIPICGSVFFIQPQTIYTNGAYTLDLYDDQSNVCATVSGSVDSNGFCLDPNTGTPGITVSLLDTNGNDLPSTSFTADVETWPAAPPAGLFRPLGQPSAQGKWKKGHEGSWSYFRGWVMAYAPVYGDIVNLSDAPAKLAGIMNGAATAVVKSAYGSEGSLNGDYTTSSGTATALVLNESSDWNRLLALLHDPVSRNFYYYGHGWTDLIGKRSSLHWTDQDLQSALQNPVNPLSTNRVSQHPYRFVFLDGCKTASGNLPVVFGIPKKTVSDALWLTNGLAARSFIGWNHLTATMVANKNTPPAMDDLRVAFMQNFWANWSAIDSDGNATGNPPEVLQKALQDASQSFYNSITTYGSPTLPFYQ